MRWKARDSVKIGDTRRVSRFFIFPQRFGDTWVWLEWGKVYQIRVESYIYEMGCAIPNHKWRDKAIENI